MADIDFDAIEAFLSEDPVLTERKAVLADLSAYDHALHWIDFGSDPYELPDDATPEQVENAKRARTILVDIEQGPTAFSSALVAPAPRRGPLPTGQHTIALDLDFGGQVVEGGGVQFVSLDFKVSSVFGGITAQGMLALMHSLYVLGVAYDFQETPRGIVFRCPQRACWVPSSTFGHGHLYIDKILWWEEYEALLEAFAWAGLVEPGYVGASKRREATHLRLPWVKKADPNAEPEPF